MNEMITFRDVINAFPSREDLALGVGERTQAIHRWHFRDTIPPHFDARVVDLAEKMGVPIGFRDLAMIRARSRNLLPAL